MRQKYIPTIIKYEEQNKKIQLKLLEKKEIKCKELEQIPTIILNENLLNSVNSPCIDKTEISGMKNKLRNLDKLVAQITNKKNCNVYKELELK
ncbi:hypothetical protein CBL_08436 [Carabus blaptoides fortunei]